MDNGFAFSEKNGVGELCVDANNGTKKGAVTELLKSFPEFTRNTAVVLAMMGLGYCAQQFREWPEGLENS